MKPASLLPWTVGLAAWLGLAAAGENIVSLTLFREDGSASALEVNRNQATLDLSGQGLVRIAGMEKMANLHNFDGSSNKLTALPGGITNQPRLQTVNVDSNLLSELPGFGGSAELRVVRAARNRVVTAQGYDSNRKLQKLDLSSNLLQSLKGLEKIADRCELDVRFNPIPCPQVCEYIKLHPSIAVLSSCDCPQ